VAYRVLIADDFALMREGIRAALESNDGIEVVGQAENGLEAVERAQELRPDVLILDLRMGDHGGMEALDACRELNSEVKVLVLTANENPDNLHSAIAAGATGYLTKQATGGDLSSAVLAVAAGSRVVAPSLVGSLATNDVERSADERAALRTLTARQRAVVRLLSAGLTDTEIAEKLFVSTRTIQHDLSQVKRKAGLSHRSEVARWAVINALA